MKRVVPLSEMQVRRAKATEKSLTMFDGGGLFLLVNPEGSKFWRFKFCLNGKWGLLSFGSYPEVSLSTARVKRLEARKLLAAGVDPSEHRKAEKLAKVKGAENSFENIAREWFFSKLVPETCEAHQKKVLSRLEKDVFPWLGSEPVREITPGMIADVLRRIQGRGTLYTARRALGDVSRVLCYAVGTGRLHSDPARDLRDLLPAPRETHFAAITDPAKFGDFLRAVESYQGGLVVKSALQLAPLLVVRPGELRKMEWGAVDLEAGEWRFTVTKTQRPHIVPISRQAGKILRDLFPLTGYGRYVFPNPRTPDGSRPMSENAVLAAIRNLGYQKGEMTGHGFRAIFRTLGAEKLGFRIDFMEHQLSHEVRDPLGRAYNRAEFLEERREMMQQWADYLENTKGKVS